MKAVISTFLILAATVGSKANADSRLRSVHCYSNPDETGLIFSGDYQFVSELGAEPVRARLVIGVQNGRCLFGDEVTLPACASMSAMVYLTSPCVP